MRVVFVVQRYGLEVCGGAELHCRWVTERLTEHFEVHVVTTCALNYLPWDNYYPEGDDVLNGVQIHRFRVDKVRPHHAFDALTRRVFTEAHTLSDELQWVEMLGPSSSGLLSYLQDNRQAYDAFLFFTYCYAPSFYGLPLVRERAVLAPLAPEDGMIYLDIFAPLFGMPRMILYNTEAERRLIEWRFKNGHIPHLVVGTGINPPESFDAMEFRRTYGITEPIAIYVGRIDRDKGCDQLFRYFTRYLADRRRKLKLVLVGKPEMPVPAHPAIIPLGFLSEEEKYNAIAAAEVMILPSPYESLSMANLEAWQTEVPVLANGACQVLKENCLLSQGGLYYTDYE
ncbi:MAG: glycosyltransferase family 4 protein, partial [Chloroflexi bacterium]|nr:glycosyltransferase family 4 protein [Chloroflexota bacterium]